MKIKYVMAAAAVLCASAHAQTSSVTLFGVVDAAVRHGKGSIGNMTSIGSGGIAGSRFGLRGVEDLGGGLSASFWLEAQFDSSTGVGSSSNTNNQASGVSPAIFNRRSIVSLLGAWGEVRVGREYTPQFLNVSRSDPYETNGIGTSTLQTFGQAGLTNTRASNSLSYLLPSGLGGVYGQVMTFFGENLQNGAAIEDDGNGWSTRLGIKQGSYDIAIATARTSYAAGDVRTTNLLATYSLSRATLYGTYQQDRVVTGTGRGWLLGATYRVIPTGLVRVAYSTYERALTGHPESSKLAIGYVHDLSKRTAVYGTFAAIRNSGSANLSVADAATAPGRNSRGVEFGMRHSF